MNRSTNWLRLFGATLALCTSAALNAQSTDTGSIKGRVTDDKGQPLPGAVVKAKGAQGTKGAEADSNGNYNIPFLTPGTYEVSVTMDGFDTVVQSGVSVTPLSAAVQPFKLQAGKGEVITVAASRVHIDQTSVTSKTTINLSDAINNFAQGNAFAAAFDFAPGTNGASGIAGGGNVSISGASGFENQYLIGGVNITNGGYGAMGAYDRFAGVVGSGVTTEFLGDMTVREGGFEAEYGQALGGVISANVKSGTNDLAGAVTAYWSPRGLDGARSSISQYYPSGATDDHGTDKTDLAFSVGGPLIKDKLFYFVAYNPVWTRATREFVVTNTAAIANDGIIGGAPYINNEYSFGTTRVDNYAVHLNWNLSDKHKLDFLVFGSPQRSSGIQVGAGLRVGTAQDPGVAIGPAGTTGTIPDISAARGASGTAKGDDIAASVKYFGTLTPWMNLEAQVSYHKIKTSLDPDYKGISYTDIRRSQLFTARQLVGLPQVMSANQYQFGSTFGYSTGTTDKNITYSLKATNNFNGAGAHELKYGFEFADIRYAEANQFAPPITLNDASGQPITVTSGLGSVTMRCGSINTNGATGIGNACNTLRYRSTRTRINPMGLETKNQETNFFVQDKWTIKNVVLSIGARYSSEKVANENNFSIRLPNQTTPTTFYGQSYKFPSEIAPRLGISWDVNGDGKSKLYASYGRMYERIPNDLAVRSFGNEASISRVTSRTPDFTGIGVAAAPGGIFTPTCVAGASIDQNKDPANYGTFGSTCGGAGTKETKLPYKDEFVLGYQYQISPTLLVELKGIYRKQGRLLEDTQPVTVEATTNYYASYYGPGYGGIFGNCTANCPADPSTPYPGFGASPFGGYVLANVGENAPNYFYNWVWNPALGRMVKTNQKIGVGYGSPDNKYKALSFTITKQRDADGHISAEVSYRLSKLRGNYEGLYRNDNGQSDPNISSLYDFPYSPLLAGQFLSGPLNTDVPNSLRARIGYADLFIKNLSAAVTFKWEAGIPRTPMLAHPNFAYNNAGEVPGFNPIYMVYQGANLVQSYTAVQRGFQGRTPDVATWDVKFGYRWNLGKSALDFSVLVNNLFNNTEVTRWNQNVENSAGVLNPLYGLPTTNAGYRTIRLGAKWSF